MKKVIISPKKILHGVVLISIILVSIILLLMSYSQAKDLITGNERINSESATGRILQPTPRTTLFIGDDALANKPDLVHRARVRSSNINTIYMILNLAVILIILVQTMKIIRSLSKEKFFVIRNLKIVRRMSYVIFTWVFLYFMIYQIACLALPLEIMEENVNMVSLSMNFWPSLILSIDTNALFIAFLLYVLSMSFREGLQLQQEIDLTV